MDRKIFLLVLALFVFSCNAKKSKVEDKPVAVTEPETKNERPVMSFTLSDGNQVNAEELEQQMILVLLSCHQVLALINVQCNSCIINCKMNCSINPVILFYWP